MGIDCGDWTDVWRMDRFGTDFADVIVRSEGLPYGLGELLLRVCADVEQKAMDIHFNRA